jgi:D-alanyl-D-alanine carboxypeptidase
MDEIPVAQREQTKQTKQTKSPPVKIIFVAIAIALGLLGIILVSFSLSTTEAISNSSNTEEDRRPENKNATEQDNSASNLRETEAQDLANPNFPIPLEAQEVQENQTPPENLLGHLPYKEASSLELKPITSDGRIQLRTNAAEKFKQMQADARASGIILVPLSGFRSIAAQEYLFFQVKEQRAQVASKRAEVSAPPGYSEHHTGYAVDIGDGRVPATHLSTSFEKTAAYKWLEQNAAKYSFELSFTPDNFQGISYEPWHWRYVGDTHSLETFYKARNLKSNLK